MKFFYLSILSILFFSCKNDSAVEESNVNLAELSEEQVYDRAQEIKNLVLPSGCDLLSLDDVADTFGIDAASIDFLDWPATYISSKISTGEGFSDGSTTLYQPLKGLGVDGAYNHEQGKYYWRSAEDLIFMIAYNLEIEGPERLKHVKVLGKKIMDNYRNLAK